MSDPTAIPRRLRPAVARFAEVVCPPEIRKGDRTDELVRSFDEHLAALPLHMRMGLLAMIAAVDEGARLYPPCRGRRLRDVGDEVAARYYDTISHAAPVETFLKLLKSLVVFHYYEIPDVRRELEFEPDGYIEQVAKRRLSSYSEEIRRGEARVLEKESDDR